MRIPASAQPITTGSAWRTALRAAVVGRVAAWILAVPPAATAGDRLNFENDVVPILSRFGCNSSGCHGKAEGQAGFKLSVFGSDPEADYRALVMEARGRRLFPTAPDSSLLLKKASGGMPHGGGIRIDRGRPEYARLRDWIVQGMPFGSADDPQVVAIAVAPKSGRLRLPDPAAESEPVALRVTATWSDGRQTDVTPLAVFQSNNEAVVRVDDQGRVTSGGRVGSGAVMATYLGRVDLFQAVVPRSEPAEFPPDVPQFNFIDEYVDARLRDLQIVPAPPATDAEFLRRVYLDVIGTLPTAEEARAFLADVAPDRRRRLVDRLLERPEYADSWALFWADALRVDREVLGHRGAYLYYRWIREQLAANRPLDAMARELVTAAGPLDESGPGQFFRVASDPGEAASTLSQVFLGVRIACAQCHHHPYDRWSQTDYYGMQAFFTPLQRRASPQGEILIAEGDPETRHPRTNVLVTAHALGAPMPERNPPGDRRAVLADWLTSPQNPWFARNFANRVWAQMMGRGLVEPVDDFRETNPPSHPELLDALAQRLIDSRYDLKELIRTIAASRVYQQSIATNPTNADDEQNYSRALLRRMSAEVFLDAVCQATGVPEKFEGVPSGVRAIQLWDSRVEHDFLRQFGRPLRKTACTCERSVEPSVAQVLHLLNSERIDRKLSHAQGTVARLERAHADDAELVAELYLAFLSRYPTAYESALGVELLSRNAAGRRPACEDLAWSLLNSLEFVFK